MWPAMATFRILFMSFMISKRFIVVSPQPIFRRYCVGDFQSEIELLILDEKKVNE